VGDTLYGAPRSIPAAAPKRANQHPTGAAPQPATEAEPVHLERNFLHAAHLEFVHPQTGKLLAMDAPLPAELTEFLALLRTEHAPVG